MLIANLKGRRIEATVADRGPTYHCPKCSEVVILKKGRIVTHHFAHKPPVHCSWAKGETREHLKAKQLFKQEFVRRGLRVKVEHEIPSLPNDRRADVVIWSPRGQRFALELQHTPIDYNSLENRTQSYIHADVRVIWVPFMRPNYWKEAKELGPNVDGDLLIERFPARPLEKWVHGFNFGKFWMFDSIRNALWRAKLYKHEIYVEESSWYEPDGEEVSAGGYSRISRRWRELKLWGPYDLDQVSIREMNRPPNKMGNHIYPGGQVGEFVVYNKER